MKSKPSRASVSHKNSDFGMISVMRQSCTALISKVECHILDRFCALLWYSSNTYSARCGSK